MPGLQTAMWLQPRKPIRKRVACLKAPADLPAAHSVLEDQLGRLAGEGNRRRRQVEAYRARLWLAEGKVATAAQWAAQGALDLHDHQDESAFQREAEQVALARILLAQASGEEALSMLGRPGPAAETAGLQSTVNVAL